MRSKKYTDNQIEWLKRYVDTEFNSVREAVDKEQTTTIAKFEAQNEWRGQFKDQTTTFVTRRELWSAVIAILGILVTILLYKK